jgi:hypothetical protein
MRSADKRQFKDQLFEHFARISKALSTGRRHELLELLAQTQRSIEDLATRPANPWRTFLSGNRKGDCTSPINPNEPPKSKQELRNVSSTHLDREGKICLSPVPSI